jgi:hypothetical protein
VLFRSEWMGKIEHGTIGPLHLYDIYDTVSTPIDNDLAVNVPRFENGYLYPPEGPGLGIELNEAVMKKLITRGKKPTAISK